MGATAVGFFGSLADQAQDAAKRHREASQKQKDEQAQVYWDAIRSGNLSPDQLTYSQQQLQKLYGNDKPVKELFQKLGQATGMFHKHLGAGAQGGGQPPAQMTPPPSAATAGADATPATGMGRMGGGGGAGMTPPPQAAAAGAAATAAPANLTPPPSMASVASQAFGQGADDRKFNLWKRQEDLIHQYAMEEDVAKQKAIAEAKSANPTGRPVIGPSTSVRDARVMAQQGKTFFDQDGNPIDLTAMPDEMGLKFIAWGGKHFYETFSPNQSTITVGNETYAISPMDKAKLAQGVGTALGQHLMPSTTATTDPATGQTTVAKKTPTTTGIAGGPTAGTAAAPATMTAPPTAGAPAAKAKPTAAAKTTAKPAAEQTGTAPPLDGDGHIPSNYIGSTPQIVEGANQLLDGMDVKSLPAKTKELSAALARRYGWEQGKFTPKEQVMLRESATFLQSALDDPSLAVLDRGFASRMQLSQALVNVDKEGIVGRALSTGASMNMDEQQAAFVRMYNQLVGTISGLGQLVRSGRATEATINRLKMELPNPVTTKSAADARDRIRRLQKEIDVGLAKGNFTGDIKAPAKMTGPPKADSGIVQWKRDASGNPVPASP